MDREPGPGAGCRRGTMPRWALLMPAVAVAATVLALAIPAQERRVAAATTPGPLLGMFGDHGELRLARLDPASLRPLGRSLDMGESGCAPRGGGEACWFIAPWSLTPGGARLAVARNHEHA